MDLLFEELKKLQHLSPLNT